MSKLTQSKKPNINIVSDHFNFKSTNNINDIHAFTVQPENKNDIRGIIQISHGMCEHIERYEDFMTYLAKNGFAVYGHDHLGHGQSVEFSDLGYFSDENGHSLLVEDLHKLTMIIKENIPNKKVFLLGHSMGSFVSRVYASKYSKDIDGLILSGTGGPQLGAPIGISLANFLIKKNGPKSYSKLMDKLVIGRMDSKFKKDANFVKNGWISTSSDIVDKYNKDKFCTFSFTVSAYRDLLTLSKIANKDSTFNKVPTSLPIYLFAGDKDPVGDFGTGVKKVHANLENHHIKDLELKLYKDGRHEMLNEVNNKEVYLDILNWVTKHI